MKNYLKLCDNLRKSVKVHGKVLEKYGKLPTVFEKTVKKF